MLIWSSDNLVYLFTKILSTATFMKMLHNIGKHHLKYCSSWKIKALCTFEREWLIWRISRLFLSMIDKNIIGGHFNNTINKCFSYFFVTKNTCEGHFLDSTQVQVETRILGPLLVVWWTGLGSPQLNEVDYKPSRAQVT